MDMPALRGILSRRKPCTKYSASRHYGNPLPLNALYLLPCFKLGNAVRRNRIRRPGASGSAAYCAE